MNGDGKHAISLRKYHSEYILKKKKEKKKEKKGIKKEKKKELPLHKKRLLQLRIN